MASSLVAIAAIIAAATKNENDDKWVAYARKVIDGLAFNFGGAKNK